MKQGKIKKGYEKTKKDKRSCEDRKKTKNKKFGQKNRKTQR